MRSAEEIHISAEQDTSAQRYDVKFQLSIGKKRDTLCMFYRLINDLIILNTSFTVLMHISYFHLSLGLLHIVAIVKDILFSVYKI